MEPELLLTILSAAFTGFCLAMSYNKRKRKREKKAMSTIPTRPLSSYSPEDFALISKEGVLIAVMGKEVALPITEKTSGEFENICVKGEVHKVYRIRSSISIQISGTDLAVVANAGAKLGQYKALV